MRSESSRAAWIRRTLVLVALILAATFAPAAVAAAQDEPFVTNGPDQLGERVNESEQATQRLNLAVLGLLGLAAVIGASTVVFWRLSAPRLASSGTVQPAFHIAFTPAEYQESPPTFQTVPPSAPVPAPAPAPGSVAPDGALPQQRVVSGPPVRPDDVWPAAAAVPAAAHVAVPSAAGPAPAASAPAAPGGPRPAADPFATVDTSSGAPSVSIEDVTPGASAGRSGPSGGGSWASQGWGGDAGG